MYLLFYGCGYAPEGGFHDCCGEFSTKHDAIQYAEDKLSGETSYTWAHVVGPHFGEVQIVWEQEVNN